MGINSQGVIYAEEYYEDSYIAQYSITSDGVIITESDENFGKIEIKQLALPEDIVLAQHPLTHALNYTGMRYRGMREQEKVAEWTKPLSVMEKMPLLQALDLTISPMMIFGVAESRVLSETQFSDAETIVCRRIRLLYALPEIRYDADGLPYDYETISFHVLHVYNTETEAHPPLHESIQHFSDMTHVMDCIYYDGKLIVANGSDGEKPGEVHIFQLYENGTQE